MPAFIPFKELAEQIDIEKVASYVGLMLKRTPKDLRSSCPACKSGDERTLAIYPETNSFRCYAASQSGDCIALYAHITGTGMYAAAKTLQELFGIATASRPTTPATAPQKPGASASASTTAAPVGTSKRPEPFDPAKFLDRLQFTPEVEALGLTEEEAKGLGIGATRGKLYIALRYDNGETAAYAEWIDGQFKLPKNAKLLPRTSNIVPLRRPA